jgi:hypothetical protein
MNTSDNASATQRLTTWLRNGPAGERLAGAACLLVLISLAAPWTSSATYSRMDIGNDHWSTSTDSVTTGPSGAGWVGVVAMVVVVGMLLRIALRGAESPASASEAGLIGLLGLAELGGAIGFTVKAYSYWQGYGAYSLDTVGWGVLACALAGVATLAGAALMWRSGRRLPAWHSIH